MIVGFIGVIIALASDLCELERAGLDRARGQFRFSFLMIVTRHLRGTSDTVLVTGQTVAALIFGAVVAPFYWVPLTLIDTALLALLGVVAMIAHVCVNRSLKLAPASVVVPYQYTLIVWAIVFGFVVFGDVPEIAMLVGAVIIVWRRHLHLRARAGAAREERADAGFAVALFFHRGASEPPQASPIPQLRRRTKYRRELDGGEFDYFRFRSEGAFLLPPKGRSPSSLPKRGSRAP